jgi:hypothetical protein
MRPSCWLLGFLVAVAGARANDRQAEPRLLLVVAPTGYREPLAPWLEHRRAQGYQIHVVDTESLFGVNEGASAVKLLREEIARLAAIDANDPDPIDVVGPAAFVLLVGDAPAPRERLDTARLIPAAIEMERARPSLQKQFVTDNVFGLPDERGRARVAVGRWPVRSPDEVAVQVQKALRYERGHSPGLHRRDVTFLATTPNYDPFLDPVLERMAMGMINGQVKPHWGVRAVYSSPSSDYFPGPDETQKQIVRWLEDATPFTLFAGHGYDRGVDVVRYRGKEFTVLDTVVAQRVDGARPGTVLWMSTCSCGDFDLPPPHRGLAEALMMNPRGPTAVVAGSDETSAYANLLLCTGLAQDIIEDPPATLGEAFLRFKRAAFKPGPPLLKNMLLSMEPTEKADLLPDDHQFLYNLLGDPTLPLNLPQRVAFSADVVEKSTDDAGQKRFAIAGKFENWESGTAFVSLLIDRMLMKDAPSQPATLDQEDARRAAYFDRFTKANDKSAAAARVQVQNGKFELELTVSEAVAPKVRWLQVYVHTEPSADGTWRDGVGAQAVKLVAEDRN